MTFSFKFHAFALFPPVRTGFSNDFLISWLGEFHGSEQTIEQAHEQTFGLAASVADYRVVVENSEISIIDWKLKYALFFFFF